MANVPGSGHCKYEESQCSEIRGGERAFAVTGTPLLFLNAPEGLSLKRALLDGALDGDLRGGGGGGGGEQLLCGHLSADNDAKPTAADEVFLPLCLASPRLSHSARTQNQLFSGTETVFGGAVVFPLAFNVDTLPDALVDDDDNLHGGRAHVQLGESHYPQKQIPAQIIPSKTPTFFLVAQLDLKPLLWSLLILFFVSVQTVA